MPKLIGAFRLKNESNFIEKTLLEACNYCDEIAIVDDWSDDLTIDIVSQVCYSAKIPYRIIKSPDKKYHEGRDRNLLLKIVNEMSGEWCIQIDADEVYEREFVKNIRDYINLGVDIIWVYATHMWSLEETLWYTVNTFRVDSGWSSSFLEDGTGIQNERPALFKVKYPQFRSSALRDHGHLCPKDLVKSSNFFHSRKIFAHFGYATPKLADKKCIRHGSIPAVTEEEINGVNYLPGWEPDDFNSKIAVNIFKNEWLNRNKVKLKKLERKIWSD